jgi:hypothetical protein
VLPPEDPVLLTIERLDRELLVLDGFALAGAFFRRDPSSVGDDSFDARAGQGDPHQITLDDIGTINRSMRARSHPGRWTPVLAQELSWLEAIPETLDLLEADDGLWDAENGSALVTNALLGAVGAGRGPSVVTKVLHLKRPRLFPVVDKLVAEMLGVNAPTDAPAARRAEIAADIVLRLRREGRANLAELHEIRDRLAADGIVRPLVRILDAIVWFAHPATGVAGVRRRLRVDVVDDRAPSQN